MFIIDTSVISEIRKGDQANPGVRRFFDAIKQNGVEVYLSAITLGELRRGADLINHRGDFSQEKLLENWLNGVMRDYRNHILGVDAEIALLWGGMRALNPQHALDKLIAATAIIYDLTVVTRNVDDFAGTGARLHNPFE